MSENNAMNRPEIVAKLSGKNCYMWKGGISFELYCPEFNNKLKEQVRDRYNRQCLVCGIKEEWLDRKLDVHHVDYNKKQGSDGHDFKLVPLCRSCHVKTNFNRAYWEDYFNTELMQLEAII